MAKVDLEEGWQETNVISNEPNSLPDREREPLNEVEYDPVVRTLITLNSGCEDFFLWPPSVDYMYCCIYRVPCRLRRVNPEAYTPQMLLMGPLHHSKKTVAVGLCKTDLRHMEYMKMERHKKKYLENFTHSYGKESVDAFKRIITRDEKIIRACYEESTDFITSHEFVEMMLLDSVFILVFLLQLGTLNTNKTGDFIFDAPCYISTIYEDLILLENQLPYILLENLFEPFIAEHAENITFRDIILTRFDVKGKIRKEVKFLHFTDLSRRVRVETLGLTEHEKSYENKVSKNVIKNLRSANQLRNAGIKFVGCEEEKDTSLVIKFDSGILTMPCFSAEDSTEMKLRNIMALEQCHYPKTAFVCNYIIFLDFLIDTEQDVDFLVKKGIVRNWMGHAGSIAEMVNKLCLGLVDYGSHYYNIAESLNNHCKSRLNRSSATLRRVYFKDLWTGTATVAAVVLLALTLIGTVASLLQLTQNDDNPTMSPPPAQKI